MKQIIILEQHPANGGVAQLNVLFWFSVAAGREVPNPGASSRYRGVTDVENGEIAAGRVVEEAFTHTIMLSMIRRRSEIALAAGS